jgi:signal transduction histidine kinase
MGGGSILPLRNMGHGSSLLLDFQGMTISAQRDTVEAHTLAAPSGNAASGKASSGAGTRRRLFTKYVALFVGVVGIALLTNGIFEVFFYYREHKAALIRIQHEQAVAAAAKISQFIKEIENQIGWTTQLPWSAGSIEQRRFDALRLLRQVPAITELAEVDSSGKERLRVSRLAMDVIDSGIDFSKDPKFTEAMAHKVYYGPVYFRRESEPYMTLAVAGTRKDAGVSIAEVNLKLIWDVVSQIKVGEQGRAYVVDSRDRLIAHPDISLVLRNTDMSGLAQVQAARANGGVSDDIKGALNIQGREVLTASAPIPPLRWTMFVELPVQEAYASLYAALQRLAIVLLAASIFAVLAGIFLARRMVVPIRALRAGAERIGGGDFSHRISIETGDELERLANQFNDMGARLQESYADLEGKVDQRTFELREALERQTATADILKVIASSPSDEHPVFEAIAGSAKRLIRGFSSTVFRFIDGNAYLEAFTPTTPAADEVLKSTFPRPVSDFAPFRMAQAGEVMQISDTEVLSDDIKDVARARGFRSMLFAPLMNKGASIGFIAVTRLETGAFADHHVQLLRTFADQAVIAIENARLFEEVRAKTHDLEESLQQQTATADVLKVISRSAFDLQTVLDTLAESAARLCDADEGTIVRPDGDVYRMAAIWGASPEKAAFLRSVTLTPGGKTAAGRALLERRTVHIEDTGAYPDSLLPGDPNPVLTRLAVPLLREGAPIGVFVLVRQEARPFSDKQIELVQTFADQAVIAIENARLFDEVQARTQELARSLDDLRTAQDRLIQTEKLASLGQLTAGIAHEIKNPLNFVNNFSAVSSELIDELNTTLKSVALDDRSREEVDELTNLLKSNLEKVVQHGKRADSIVKNMLLHSREGSGEHRLADINALVEESLNLAYHGARAEKPGFNITLKRDLDPNAGMVDVFPQEITRVFLNLISNGFYAATKRRQAEGDRFEPTLSASTKNAGNKVEVRIRDNGTGIPKDVREKIFNPFFTTKPAGEGTGLGLSMSHDIVVKQHGGRIDIATEPGVFTEFIITLPRRLAAQSDTVGGRN